MYILKQLDTLVTRIMFEFHFGLNLCLCALNCLTGHERQGEMFDNICLDQIKHVIELKTQLKNMNTFIHSKLISNTK